MANSIIIVEVVTDTGIDLEIFGKAISAAGITPTLLIDQDAADARIVADDKMGDILHELRLMNRYLSAMSDEDAETIGR